MNIVQEIALWYAEDQKTIERDELETLRNKILVLALGNHKLYDSLFDPKKNVERTFEEVTPRSRQEIEDLVTRIEAGQSLLGQEIISRPE